MLDMMIWILLVVTWILVVPMILLELWLTKRRAARYVAALKEMADLPVTEENHRRARQAAQVLIYDWKW